MRRKAISLPNYVWTGLYRGGRQRNEDDEELKEIGFALTRSHQASGPV